MQALLQFENLIFAPGKDLMRGHHEKDPVLGLRLGGKTLRQTQSLAELITPLGNGLIKYPGVCDLGKNFSL